MADKVSLVYPRLFTHTIRLGSSMRSWQPSCQSNAMDMDLGGACDDLLSSIEQVSSPSGCSIHSAPSFGRDSDGCARHPWQPILEPVLLVAPPNTGTAEKGCVPGPIRFPPPRPITATVTAQVPPRSCTHVTHERDLNPAHPVHPAHLAHPANSHAYERLAPVKTPVLAVQGQCQEAASAQSMSTVSTASTALHPARCDSLRPSPTGPTGPAVATAKMRFPFSHTVPLSTPCAARRCPPTFLWAPVRQLDSESDMESLPVPESLGVETDSVAEEGMDGMGGMDGLKSGPPAQSTHDAPATSLDDLVNLGQLEAEADGASEGLNEECGANAAGDGTPVLVRLAPARKLRGIGLCKQETAAHTNSTTATTSRIASNLGQSERKPPPRPPDPCPTEGPSGSSRDFENELDAWSTFFEDAVPGLPGAVTARRGAPSGPGRAATKIWRAAQVAATTENQTSHMPCHNVQPEGAGIRIIRKLHMPLRSETPRQQSDSLDDDLAPGAVAGLDVSSDSGSEYWTCSQSFAELEQEAPREQRGSLQKQAWQKATRRPYGDFSPAELPASLAKRAWNPRRSFVRSRAQRVTLSADTSGSPWLLDFPQTRDQWASQKQSRTACMMHDQVTWYDSLFVEEGRRQSWLFDCCRELLSTHTHTDASKVQADWTSPRQSCIPEGRQVQAACSAKQRFASFVGFMPFP